MTSENALNDFIRRLKLEPTQKTFIKSDMSNRRYIRLSNKKMKVIVMDSSLEIHTLNAFVEIALLLKKNGYSVPDIYESDLANGFLLLEDLGKETLLKQITAGSPDEQYIYRKLVDLILSFREIAIDINLPKYSNDYLMNELMYFVMWYLPLMNIEVTDKVINSFTQCWQKPLLFISNQPNSFFVHKDFHFNNLIWIPQRKGKKEFGILDFQNAKIGNPNYDFASLLNDCRRSSLPGYFKMQLAKDFTTSAMVTHEEFIEAYKIITVQRNVKILGNFAKANLEYSNAEYLQYIPQTLNIIKEVINIPILEDFKIWWKFYINNDI